MTHLIDKDALVAEIESKRKYAQVLGDNAINSSMQQFYDGMKQGCVDLLSFLDTLEVKEVYLDEEITIAMPHRYSWSGDGTTMLYTEKQMKDFAKRFFELGLKATQKGEEV